MLVCVGVIVLRYKDPGRHAALPDAARAASFRSLGIVICLYLMWELPLATWIRFGVWLLIGLVLYFFYGYRHSRFGARLGPGPRRPPRAEALSSSRKERPIALVRAIRRWVRMSLRKAFPRSPRGGVRRSGAAADQIDARSSIGLRSTAPGRSRRGAAHRRESDRLRPRLDAEGHSRPQVERQGDGARRQQRVHRRGGRCRRRRLRRRGQRRRHRFRRDAVGLPEQGGPHVLRGGPSPTSIGTSSRRRAS